MRVKNGVLIRRATQKSDSSRFRVSGLGFRVSSIETNFRCRFRVSGFGLRVSSLETNFRCRFLVSGFRFRVSIGPGEVFRVGFGFRVSGFGFRWSKPTLQTSLRITSRKTGGVEKNTCLGNSRLPLPSRVTLQPMKDSSRGCVHAGFTCPCECIYGLPLDTNA